MAEAGTQAPAGTDRQPPPGFRGEVVYLYAYDVAYEIRPTVSQLLGQTGRQFQAAATRRMPKEPFFYRPWTFDLPALGRVQLGRPAVSGPPAPADPKGPARATVKLFPVGAISIAVHVPFEVERLEDLVAYHDLQLAGGPLHAEARAIAERVFQELRPHLVRPVSGLKEDEAYTVFCIRGPLPAPGGGVGAGGGGMAGTAAATTAPGATAPGAIGATGGGAFGPAGARASGPAGAVASGPAGAGASAPASSPRDSAAAGAEAWLQANRRQVAALLTQEQDLESLSLQEAMESTGLYLSYYESDLAVIDWDAALLVDEPEDFEEFLHVAELANVQLMELGVFDQILDEAVERAYRDLRKGPPAAGDASHRPWRGRGDLRRDLGEIRIDLERLRDELFNITKFFGDWHLARVYQHLSARFHLAEWSRTIEDKLRTLNEFYQILKSDQNNRLMVILETLIVLLFIIDLVVLIVGLGK